MNAQFSNWRYNWIRDKYCRRKIVAFPRNSSFDTRWTLLHVPLCFLYRYHIIFIVKFCIRRSIISSPFRDTREALTKYSLFFHRSYRPRDIEWNEARYSISSIDSSIMLSQFSRKRNIWRLCYYGKLLFNFFSII